jgi:ABC-type amino acid transport substrate-binding protein
MCTVLGVQITGYIRGMLIIEKNLQPGFGVAPAQDPAQLFRMLEADRTEAVVTSLTIGKLMIARLGLTSVSRVGGILETVPNYHFLAGKNADIAKRLSSVLAEMEKSGRLAEITASSLARLFPY